MLADGGKSKSQLAGQILLETGSSETHSVMERKSLISSYSLLPLPSQMFLETDGPEVPFQSCALCFEQIALLSTQKEKSRA